MSVCAIPALCGDRYLTSTASELSKASNRSTIQSKDVLSALEEIDFEDFVPGVEEELESKAKKKVVKKTETQPAEDLTSND